MCGITGIVYLDKTRKVDFSILKDMTESLMHRGPDEDGYFTVNNVGFGFRRLSIIDVKNGHQPLSNSEKNIWIIFNGEIYNFIELRTLLLNKGYSFQTSSDTEVILQLYIEYGVNCVSYLRGMFSFVIYDIKNNKIFCARDRLGIKPFFYYVDKNMFLFGSEIKSLLKYPKIERSLSNVGIESYFAYGYITSDLTAFEHIKKLPQANILIIDMNNSYQIQIKPYWELTVNIDYQKTEMQWKEELLETIKDSVSHHLVSDVPLGAFLSGGIDSSSVVAIMSKMSALPVKTFSIGFKEQNYNELQYAREIAEKYKTEHHELVIEPESIDLLPLLVKCYDEPFADSSAIPTFYVSKFARQFVTVALSGDGGDELFAGYNAYKKLLAIVHNNFVPDSISKALFGNLYNIWPEKLSGKGLLYYLSIEKSKIGAYYNLWKQQERKLLYKGDFLNSVSEEGEKIKLSLLNKIKTSDFICGLTQLDIQTYLVDDILTKVDRVSMQNSLEVRVPLLDHKLVELAFTIPSNLKVKNGMGKYIYKKTVSHLLTENVVSHPKQGFAMPLGKWFKNDLKSYMQDVLLNKSQPIYTFLDYQYVDKVINNHLLGLRNMSSKVWSLLFFNEWLNQNSK